MRTQMSKSVAPDVSLNSNLVNSQGEMCQDEKEASHMYKSHETRGDECYIFLLCTSYIKVKL